MAHACGVSVEGELGCLGSLETGQAGEEDGIGAEGTLSHDQMLTDPEEAAKTSLRKLALTRWRSLAVLLTVPTSSLAHRQVTFWRSIASRRSTNVFLGTHLVMHGSSSVPQEWLAVINEFGGEIPETYGVPVEQIVEGIKYGVRKVNIDTDLRLASTGAVRRFLAENPAEFDPRKYPEEIDGSDD